MLKSMEVNEVLNICDEFLEIPSIVGFEKPFLEYLESKAKGLNLNTILKDNYLVINSKKKSNILYSVHIDRQGFVLNNNKQIEYATNYVKKTLGLSFRRQEQEENEINLKNFLLNKINNNNDNNLSGGNIDNFNVYLDDLFLRFKSDIYSSLNFFRQDGPNDMEKIALRYVGDSIISFDKNSGNKLNEFKINRYDLDWKNHGVYFGVNNILSKNDNFFMLKSSINKFGNKFSGQIDNVISAAVLFYLLENFDDFNANIIFTCGEEMGQSYKSVIDYYNDFNLINKTEKLNLIVLDTSPYFDFIGKKLGFLVLRHGDERGGFNLKLVNKIKLLLEENQISFDFKPSFLGRTELGKIALISKNKINGTTLQLPSLNYHTSYETSTVDSLNNYIKVIYNISK